MQPATIAKAIVGTLAAGLGALATALTDGQITPVEWVTVAASAVTAAGAVFGVPNKPSGTVDVSVRGDAR